MSKPALVVLISGSGSNLQAIIDAIKSGQLNAEIKAVICNVDNAGGITRARAEDIPVHIVDHKQYDSRESFDAAMIKIIDQQKPDLVVLAGFMRILSKSFIASYAERLINIHPSLLPKYKGLNTHQQTIDNKDARHGASVHYVSDELDSGPLVIQAEVEVSDNDTVESLAAKVLHEEHIIFPLAISLHLEQRLSFRSKQLLLDNKPLSKPLLWKNGQLITER